MTNISKRLLFLAASILLVSPAESLLMAQQTGHDMIVPDCQLFFNFTGVNAGATGTTPPLANYGPGSVNGPNLCTTWTIAYATISTGTITSLSLRVESAPPATTTTPGTFVAYAGTVITGVNPNVSITGAQTFLSNLTVSIPWIRVKLTALSATGTTNIFGILQGWNTGHSGSSSTVIPPGSPCAGTAGSPCVVDGPDATGGPSTKPPVQVAGNDGANVQAIKTDTNGQTIPANASSANADGINNSNASPTGAAGAIIYNRTIPYIYNGATDDRQFACTNQQLFNLAAGTDVVIVTGVATQKVRLCNVSFSGDTNVTATFRQGTGSTCGTGTAAITGGFVNVLGFVFDFSSLAPLRTTVAANDMCLHLSAAATGGGVAIYATY